MKGKDVEKIIRGLLEHFPDFAVSRDLFFRVPLNGFFVGLAFGSSNWDKSTFYLNMLCQPLFKGQPYIGSFHLEGLSKKDGQINSWSWSEADVADELIWTIESQLLPFARQMSDPLNFVKYAEGFKKHNPHIALQDIYLTLAWIGAHEKAVKAIDELVALPDSPYDGKVEFEIRKQSIDFRNLLLNDPLAANALLSERNDFSIQKLHLSKFA